VFGGDAEALLFGKLSSRLALRLDAEARLTLLARPDAQAAFSETPQRLAPLLLV
jgi:hypothetical protein